MRAKKFVAVGLITAMFFSTTGIAAYAGEEMVVEAVEVFDNGTLDESSILYENAFATGLDAGTGIDNTADIELAVEEEAVEEIGEILDEKSAEARPDHAFRMLIAKVGEDVRQVIVYGREDGTWADVQGNLFTQNEDGNWTDENGVIYQEVSKDGENEFTDPDYELTEDDEDDTVIPVITEDDSQYAFINASKQTAKASIDGFIDMICRTQPELLPLLYPLKMVVGEMFGLSGSQNPNKVVLEKLAEIEKHLDKMEANLKEHFENVVAFDSIGGEFQKLADAIPPMEDKIGDYAYRYEKGKISREEYIDLLAGLYSSGEYNSLMQAISGASNSFTGNTSFTIDQRSIFGAAYNLQCGSVMFSGEAVDCVTPYLLRQLCNYLKGYTLINMVLDAYDKVNGSGSTTKTRDTMFKYTGGVVNGEFDARTPGVFGLFNEFFKTYRYTFVNKSSNRTNHVKLSKKIITVFSFTESYLGKGVTTDNDKLKAYTPPVMSDFPLSAEQMEALAAYAKEKNTSVYNLLFDVVGFEHEFAVNMALLGIFGPGYDYTKLSVNTCVPNKINTLIPGFDSNSFTIGYILKNGATCMPAGPQYFTTERTVTAGNHKTIDFNYMQAVKINKAGAGNEKLMLGNSLDPDRVKGSAVNANMLFFVRG